MNKIVIFMVVIIISSALSTEKCFPLEQHQSKKFNPKQPLKYVIDYYFSQSMNFPNKKKCFKDCITYCEETTGSSCKYILTGNCLNDGKKFICSCKCEGICNKGPSCCHGL